MPGLLLSGILNITMLSKSNRFHGYGSQKYLYKNGTSVRSHLLTIKYIVNPKRQQSRVSVVISKKVHKSAVGRNRVRRRVYEIIRQELPKFKGTYDIAVIIISGDTLNVSHQELSATIINLLRQTTIYGESKVL